MISNVKCETTRVQKKKKNNNNNNFKKLIPLYTHILMVAQVKNGKFFKRFLKYKYYQYPNRITFQLSSYKSHSRFEIKFLRNFSSEIPNSISVIKKKLLISH